MAYDGDPRGAVAGLYGAIFTGFFASLLGGTPRQITGPTGGMTVILTLTYKEYGGPDVAETRGHREDQVSGSHTRNL